MTRITNAEQVLLLLRAHLQRARQAERSSAAAKTKGRVRQGPVQRVQELSDSGTLSKAELERALISGLLCEEFGASISNDPHFQRVIDDVAHALRQDELGKELMARAVAQLSTRR